MIGDDSSFPRPAVSVFRGEPNAPTPMRFQPPQPVQKQDYDNYAGTFLSGSRTEPSRLGVGVTPHPFHLEDTSNPTDGTQVRVYYGTVNDNVPSGMSDGDDPPYILPVSGNGVVYLVITVDDPASSDDITSVTIASGASVPASDDTTAYKEIGSFSDNGDGTLTVADNLTGSQSYTRCRNWFSNPATYTHVFSVV